MAIDLPRTSETDSMLAVINASFSPLLLLDVDLTVIAASASFCEAFNVEPLIAAQPLAGLGAGEWNAPQLTSLLRATASGLAEVNAYEMDLLRGGQEPRLLVVNARRLEHADKTGAVRLLLTILDVTDARASEKLKDDLLRENAILLQEVQHRVANSLQIIASVLMQSARKVQSDEARGHLNDAHLRVLSIAAVQQQLAASRLGDVVLRPYLAQLCDSLGASMIRDHHQLSIDVTVDDSLTSANASISIGLIVTELVINALKHAFPGHRHGKIRVAYETHGPKWTLSVSDDGVGMPTGAAAPKPGLGTGIVEALVRQLHAEMRLTDAAPGTAISISHLPELAVVKSDQARTGSEVSRGGKAY